jgi:hypothetical protein
LTSSKERRALCIRRSISAMDSTIKLLALDARYRAT